MNVSFKVNDSLMRVANDSLSFSERIVRLVDDVAHTFLPAHESHKRMQGTNGRSRIASRARNVLECLALSSRSPEQSDSREGNYSFERLFHVSELVFAGSRQ
jgi:hypothetical protein